MTLSERRKTIADAQFFIESQRRLDAMEGDSNLVNALQALADVLDAMTEAEGEAQGR